MERVFIPTFSIDYEPGYIIGVYSTKRRAENAVKRWKIANAKTGHYYEYYDEEGIEEVMVDAVSESRVDI